MAESGGSREMGVAGPLEEAIAEYLRAAEAGAPPAPVEFLARHRAVASELEEFLDNREMMEGLSRAARDLAPPAAETAREGRPGRGRAGDETGLVRRAARGDGRALEVLFARHIGRLRRMVRVRLDSRLRGRVSEAEVIQEVCVEAARRLTGYLREPELSFFLWLRGIAGEKLVDLHCRHLGEETRDGGGMVTLHHGSLPAVTSAVLAARLLGTLTTLSEETIEAGLRLRLQQALNSMDPGEREVLVLRHFEQLTAAETARELSIEVPVARERYTRALKRLGEILASLSGGLGEP